MLVVFPKKQIVLIKTIFRIIQIFVFNIITSFPHIYSNSNEIYYLMFFLFTIFSISAKYIFYFYRFTIYKVHKASKKKREKSSAKKERKATKTLAIVLGK